MEKFWWEDKDHSKRNQTLPHPGAPHGASPAVTCCVGAAEERCQQRLEQVFLCQLRVLFRHGEQRCGGHSLELACCQLVLDVQ